MQILTTDKTHHAPNGENEADALQALAIMGYLAMDTSWGGVLGNQKFLAFGSKMLRILEKQIKWTSCLWKFGGGCAKIGKRKANNR